MAMVMGRAARQPRVGELRRDVRLNKRRLSRLSASCHRRVARVEDARRPTYGLMIAIIISDRMEIGDQERRDLRRRQQRGPEKSEALADFAVVCVIMCLIVRVIGIAGLRRCGRARVTQPGTVSPAALFSRMMIVMMGRRNKQLEGERTLRHQNQPCLGSEKTHQSHPRISDTITSAQGRLCLPGNTIRSEGGSSFLVKSGQARRRAW